MARTAVILTTYNRPRLIADAIRSVLQQSDPDWRLYVMDDGSTRECREAQERAFAPTVRYDANLAIALDVGPRTPSHPSPVTWFYPEDPSCGVERGLLRDEVRVVWWHGQDRDLIERKRTISYSRSINIALNYLLQDERYICYLVDDDFYYPEAILERANYLDAHPDVHVVTGRQRSIQYDALGFNSWAATIDPQAGMAFPRPTGRRELLHDGAAAKCYFEHGETDPQTGLPYVEEAFWQAGPHWYGKPFRHDHNSVMHRRSCLMDCGIDWYGTADAGGVQYWGEDFAPYGVGDANFFERLGSVHPFVGLDTWVASKRYHAKSDGVQTGAVRE